MKRYDMCLDEIRKIYFSKKKEIKQRLSEFGQIWERQDNKEIFAELVFCLLTPQSKAKTCWRAVSNLIEKNVLWDGETAQILAEVKNVRFKNNKTCYIEEARKYFIKNNKINIAEYLKCPDVFKLRDWLVSNVKGIGYKEASHFLRNIGLGKNIAILDRHVLKNLKASKVIKAIPKSLPREKYLQIEKKMIKFSDKIKIPVSYLDFIFWSKETGEIFK